MKSVLYYLQHLIVWFWMFPLPWNMHMWVSEVGDVHEACWNCGATKLKPADVAAAEKAHELVWLQQEYDRTFGPSGPGGE